MFHCRFHQALEIVGHLPEPGPDFLFVLLRKVTAKVCFVASIAEVGSSLEIDRSCFVALDRCSIGFVIVYFRNRRHCRPRSFVETTAGRNPPMRIQWDDDQRRSRARQPQ